MNMTIAPVLISSSLLKHHDGEFNDGNVMSFYVHPTVHERENANRVSGWMMMFEYGGKSRKDSIRRIASEERRE